MLNPFPTMWLALLAHFLLRLFVAWTLVQLGLRHLSKPRASGNALKTISPLLGTSSATALAVLELALGILILIGLQTQYAALGGMIMATIFIVYGGKLPTPLFPSRLYYTLLLGAFVSLFITGAGAFAFDLPL